jgi:hypothetical protein
MKTLILLAAAAVLAAGEAPAPLYAQDFDKAEAVPDELMCNGEYTLVEAGTGKALALNPLPLDSYNIHFGPSRKDPASARVRIFAESKGRQSPAFGVGLNGVSGVIVRLATQKDQLEIVHGEAVVAKQPMTWKTGTWTCFVIRTRPREGGGVHVEGKAWADGATEPAEWMIKAEVAEALPSGRATAWGMPYGGKPILFDDLRVDAAAP